MSKRVRRPYENRGKRTGPRRRGRKDRQRELIIRTALFGAAILLVITGTIVYNQITGKKTKDVTQVNVEARDPSLEIGKPQIDVNLLSFNEFSRPGLEIGKVKDIVIHYTANPNTSAKNNRNYFEGLKDSKDTKASSHFIVGLEGEIVQCIPTKEIAYASNDRNGDSISIENCHPDDSGKFTKKTYDSLVQLTAWLCKKFNLTSDNVIRHYDVTNKLCPKYYVEHEDEWIAFKKDVQEAIEKLA